MSRKRKQREVLVESPSVLTASLFKDISAVTAGMDHLRLADDRLVPLIESFGAPERLLSKDTSCFRSLAKSIIYQQLAGSAAAAIYARFLGACGVADESQLTPGAVLAAPLPALRGCGLSERKASYLVDLAAHFQDGRLSDELLMGVSDAELLERLTAVRGIGPWTVDMFAIFHLGHPNILPVGDLGVRKGLAHLCGLKHLPSPEEMQQLTDAWQPYRSLGSYYMWRIPLPPSSRQSSKANGSKASRAASSTPTQPYRAPAPTSPLGGAVPAVADVGVNPLAPVQAVPAAAAAASPGGNAVLQAAQAAGPAAAAAAAAALPPHMEEVPLAVEVTPVKPAAPNTAAAAAELTRSQGVRGLQPAATTPSNGGPGASSTGNTPAAAAGAAGGAVMQPHTAAEGGMLTRRRLRWAQQAAAQAATGALADGAGQSGDAEVPQGSTAQHKSFKARIVDL